MQEKKSAMSFMCVDCTPSRHPSPARRHEHRQLHPTTDATPHHACTQTYASDGERTQAESPRHRVGTQAPRLALPRPLPHSRHRTSAPHVAAATAGKGRLRSCASYSSSTREQQPLSLRRVATSARPLLWLGALAAVRRAATGRAPRAMAVGCPRGGHEAQPGRGAEPLRASHMED